jgi:hypothetical protein
MSWKTLNRLFFLLGGGLLSCAHSDLYAQGSKSQTEPPVPLVEIKIFPSEILLAGPRSSQRILVQGYYADGYSEDVTDKALLQTPDAKTIKIDSFTVYPLSSGLTTLQATIGNQSAAARVQTSNIEKPAEWNFRNDVIPVLTKSGCNMGACHGAAVGKNGFKLTLRGYDPEADYKVLTREAVGRRIDPQEPARSLFLLKPTLTIPHAGGRRFGVDSKEYQILSEWISEGMKPPSLQDHRITQISIEPRSLKLRLGAKQQLLVLATFDNGQREDMTRWVRFESTNSGAAVVDDRGSVQMKGSGEAGITAMVLSKVDVASLIVPFPNHIPEVAYRQSQKNNFIDQLVIDKLKMLNLEPSGLSTDSEFMRRAYLDATGTLPTATETKAFLSDSSSNKRAQLIERLLVSDAYVDYWAYKWSDLLLVSAGRTLTGKLTPPAVRSFYQWIRDSVQQNKPWNDMVREIYVSSGSSRDNGGLNFYQLHKDPIGLSETTTVAFMGLRLTCARCHNHPLEKYTQVDYYRMANLFARVKQKTGDNPGEIIVFNSEAGDIDHPRLNRPLPPAPLDAKEIPLTANGRREVLADWLTSPENKAFSRTIVNRVWGNYMGRGLVDPVDDLRSTNPPSNEPLMNALVEDFVQHGYDIKHLARTIMNSAAYQRSWKTTLNNVNDDRYYSHYLIKRLPAEVLLDAVSQISEVPTNFDDFPVGTRALQLPDTAPIASYFLDAFGRPERINTCACERDSQPNLRQALHIINGDTINKKLSAKGSLIDKAVQSGVSNSQFVEQLYLAAFSRYPSKKEQSTALKALQDASDENRPEARKEALEDFTWAMLTGREFIFNH